MSAFGVWLLGLEGEGSGFIPPLTGSSPFIAQIYAQMKEVLAFKTRWRTKNGRTGKLRKTGVVGSRRSRERTYMSNAPSRATCMDRMVAKGAWQIKNVDGKIQISRNSLVLDWEK